MFLHACRHLHERITIAFFWWMPFEFVFCRKTTIFTRLTFFNIVVLVYVVKRL